MKVCILGFNLSSLTLAKALVNQNINVDMFVSKKNYITDKSRTLGISKSNIEFFNKDIINIEKIIWKLKKIEIFTENLKKKKILNFERSNDQLFSITKNFQLVNLLENSLSKNKYFKKKTSRISLNKLNYYNLVINTDYLNLITLKYFNKKIKKKYNSLAFTTTIKHSEIENNVATQIFTSKGPLAFLPISKRETSIVYSIHNKSLKTKEDIEVLIRNYNFKYDIKKIEKISSFELKSVALRSYYHENILAFGDMLHKIHPLAGQGFNMTIRDIKALSGLIKKKIDLGLPLDKSIIIEFEKISKHKNYIFINGIDLIHEFFNFERKLKSNILSKSVQFFGKNNSVNKIFTKIADEGIFF